MRYCPDCGTKVVRRSKRWISVLLVISLFVGTAFGGWAIGTALAKRVLGPSDKLDNVKINSAEDAISFSKELGKELGYENALSELTEKVTTTVDGDSYYRLQQNYQGIPVYGKNVVYATDSHGSVTSVTGNVLDIDDEINLKPSATAEQIAASVSTYLMSQFGAAPFSQVEIGNLSEKNLYIYNNADNSVLAYAVYADAFEILVDACSSEILNVKQTINSSGGSSSSKREWSTWRNVDGSTILGDSERNIYIYDAGGKTYANLNTGDLNPNVLTLVSSKDNLFGNRDDNTKTSSVAASFLQALTSVYDYYNSPQFGYETGYGVIAGIYDDAVGKYDGHNAGGGIEPIDKALPSVPPGYDRQKYNGKIGMITIGKAYRNNFYNVIDLLGHEYTHFVSDKYVDWCHTSVVDESGNISILHETNPQNGAIREALSDIFGELIEYEIHGTTDWTNGRRIIYAPAVNGFPEVAGPGKRNENGWVIIGNSTSDYAHSYSTVISHAAYLMWNGIDGRESYKINAADLAKLWYRTMLMMPSDCNFIECRQIVEWAASSMKKLTVTQRECIGQAFDAVGIYSEDTDESTVNYKLASGSSLVVYDINGEKYLGYHLSISGYTKENGIDIEKLLQGRIGISKGKPYEYETIIDEDPAMLNLPEGNYHVTVSDSDNSGYVYGFTISVNRGSAHESIDLYTEFEKPLIVKLTEPTAEETASPDITGIYAQLPKLFSCITASGSANWELMPSSDGSFDSIIKVFDWGDNKPEYPNGTCYIRETSGIFTGLEKINDYSYRMVADRIEKIGKEGDTYIADDMRYIVEDGTGIDARDEFYLYLPGTPRSVFPQGLIDSVQNNGFHSMDEITQNTYVLYHPIPESNGYDPVFIGTSNNPAEQAESGIDMASTFGFDKAWDIHDKSGAEHMVTSLAFCEDGTFYCMVGYYLSDSAVNFRGTYLTKEDEITLQYTLNGAQTVCSYRVDWENRTLTQTSQENLIIPHQIGSKYQFEENTWLTAEGLRDKVEMYPGFLNS